MSLKLPSLPSLDDIVERPVTEKSLQYQLLEEEDWGEPLSDEFRIVNEFMSTGWTGLFHLDKTLSEAIALGASDVHLIPNRVVGFSILGDVVRQPEIPVPDHEIMDYVVRGVLSNQAHGELTRDLNYDGAYVIKFGPFAGARFRVNVGYTFSEYYMVFRLINDVIPSLKELGISDEIVKWSEYPDGLILVCGPTGSGKSTTIASIVRNIQLTRNEAIVTIERPIETVYPDDGMSIVTQRAVGPDVRSFGSGLTSAMRQDPDIIVIGEVRNKEEVNELIRAAETGHISISTMHTNSVATTVNRILSLFEFEDKGRVMNTLSDTLRGLCNQVLVKGVNGKRFAVREVLTINREISEMIAKGDVHAIRQYQRERGMTMEYQLAQAYLSGKCTYEQALKHTSFRDEFKSIIKNEEMY